MYFKSRIKQFVQRHPLAGPLLWFSSVQFFIIQAIVALSWHTPLYDWRLNAISDLGAVGCGVFDERYVCSPSHLLMNGSLVALGLSMAVGSLLLYSQLQKSRVGFSLMAVAGIGAILVGLFPEDSIYWAHVIGQDLAFVFGNIALIVFGFTLRSTALFRWYTVASGVIALIALILFLSHYRFFLELGGMERVVAYPLLIWLTVTGGAFVMRFRRVHM